MVYYVSSFLFFYFFLFLANRTNNLTPFFIIAGALPLVFLALFRGNVGTDTANYLSIFAAMQSSPELIPKIEPVFYAISWGLMSIFDDPRVIVGLFALIITLTLFFSSIKLEKYGYILGSAIIPIFYQSMTMNGIRYGLSFSIVILSAVYLLRGDRRYFFSIALIAGLIHLSGLFLAALFYLLVKKNRNGYVAVIVLAIGIIFFFEDALLIKFSAYSELESPSEISGLSLLFLSLSAVTIFIFDKNLNYKFGLQIFIIAFLVIISFILTKFSYAGLRMQSLVLFLIFLIMQYRSAESGIVLSRQSYARLIVVGILGLGFNLNNYMNEDADNLSPFVPYKFVWFDDSGI